MSALGPASDPVFLSPEAARPLVDDGALVLDARGGSAEAPFLPGAVATSWRAVRAGLLRDGRLTDPAPARAHYGALGVRPERAVLVYGAGLDGWGEEGRVWWDLKVLGHPRVFILDGGVDGWLAAGGPVADALADPTPARFEPAEATSGAKDDLRTDFRGAAWASTQGVVLDARTYEEYWGATPFLSPRGGRVPGARTLHWKRLLDPQGRLRPKDELSRLFASLGVTEDRPVVAYCTGGVRSAFVVAVLRHLALPGANYDGSWWDWSAREALPVERPRNHAP